MTTENTSAKLTFTEQEFRQVIDTVSRPAAAELDARYTAEEIAAAASELGAEPAAIEAAIASVSASPHGPLPPSPAARLPRETSFIDFAAVIGRFAAPVAGLSVVTLTGGYFLQLLRSAPASDQPPLPFDHALAAVASALTSPLPKLISIVALALCGLALVFRE